MATFVGLELLFQSASSVISEKTDVLILFIHWKLINSGWKCSGLTETDTGASELLPRDWNQNHDVFELFYIRDGKQYMLKAVQVDTQMIVSLARLEDKVTASLGMDIDSHAGDDFKNFSTAFKDLDSLSQNIESSLFEPFKTPGTQQGTSASGAQEARTTRPKPEPHYEPQSRYEPLRVEPRHDPLRVGEPRRPGRGYYNEWPFEENPFSVGGGDLDPLGRGRGGGMLMDPRHQRYPGSLGPPIGVPSNLPRGAVPPGARFDPFGPPRPDFIPPPPGAGTGGFGDPDPDHLPPPSGTEDMFM